MAERLQKILAQWGIASRRQAEQLILAGRVRLNGAAATLGQRADPQSDRIEVDGVLIQPHQRPELHYLLLNKPAGVVSSCHDPQRRPTVVDLLPPQYANQGLHPVGRLDFASTGALILTNDGHLTYGLTHPRHAVAKTYEVWVAGTPSAVSLRQWRQGVMLDGKQTLPAEVTVLNQQQVPVEQTCLRIVLQEGRNRQIRRVADLLGYPVLALHRTAIGPIQLQPDRQQALKPGKMRLLSSLELDDLRALLGILSISTGSGGELECGV